VSYAILRVESLRAKDSAVDALLCTLTEQCRQIEGNQAVDATKAARRKLLASPAMHSLIDEIVERVIARLRSTIERTERQHETGVVVVFCQGVAHLRS
jgi:hypothetical protein